MTSSQFIEFLSCVKERTKEIQLLSTRTDAVNALKSRYLESGLDHALQQDIIDKFKMHSLAFHTRCSEIKTAIEETKGKYFQSATLHTNMEWHIVVLYTQLKDQSKKFLDAKSSFLKAIDEKETAHSSIISRGRKEDSDEHMLENSDDNDAGASPHADRSDTGKNIQNILASLNDLNTTFIELNEIISSASFEIEGAAAKSFYNRNATIGVNTQIETSIVRRKRRRWLKTAFLVLLAIVCSVVVIIFGQTILDFIIKLKGAIK
ncbi:uncharacterized protein NESG_00011 [Nematocida ausubeli]|uniref:t-SNARE coiled-coil homology domain-containing protein n=1 Tax=Nematocida ausubeli (strain ATCC PRA-371 / ERTm2) TaxID=1913371 RepID=A0A086J474_NEMA1|nr:uncharacterized protein NESG_00011 [Nematocida ausubeli]KFG26942.1 hypothetical protein NESG_00011 [Nematocida ausubeli]